MIMFILIIAFIMDYVFNKNFKNSFGEFIISCIGLGGVIYLNK